MHKNPEHPVQASGCLTQMNSKSGWILRLVCCRCTELIHTEKAYVLDSRVTCQEPILLNETVTYNTLVTYNENVTSTIDSFTINRTLLASISTPRFMNASSMEDFYSMNVVNSRSALVNFSYRASINIFGDTN